MYDPFNTDIHDRIAPNKYRITSGSALTGFEDQAQKNLHKDSGIVEVVHEMTSELDAAPNVAIEKTQTTKIPPTDASNSEEIFSITGKTPADPIIPSKPESSPSTGNLDTTVRTGAHVEPAISRADSDDVHMQDLTTQSEVPRTDQDSKSAPQFSDSKGPVNPTPEHRGTADNQKLTQCHQPGTLEQPIQVETRASTPKAQEKTLRPLTPASSGVSSQLNKEGALHGVSDRSGHPRIAKSRSKPSSVGQSSRKPASRSVTGSADYTSAELYQLADFMRNKERLEEKQHWVRNLAAKQAELEQVRQQRQDLQAECARLKAILDQYTAPEGKFNMLVQCVNLVNQDMDTLFEDGDKIGRVLTKARKLQPKITNRMKEIREGVEKANASTSKMKAMVLGITQEYTQDIKKLTYSNSALRTLLEEKTKMLAQEQERHTAFEQRLKDLQSQQNSADAMIKKCTDTINEKLSEFMRLIEQDTSSRELLELVKKESANLTSQGQASEFNIQQVKESLEQLSSA